MRIGPVLVVIMVDTLDVENVFRRVVIGKFFEVIFLRLTFLHPCPAVVRHITYYDIQYQYNKRNNRPFNHRYAESGIVTMFM